MNTVDRFFLILRKNFACGAISATKQPIWIRCAANYVKNILNNAVYTKILVKMYRENSNFVRLRRQKVIKINDKNRICPYISQNFRLRRYTWCKTTLFGFSAQPNM